MRPAALIAEARGAAEELEAEIIRQQIEPRTLGLPGEPRVKVLLTNLDLDRQ